jgi:cytochrome c-type biogenesis protein CcmH/NrfG
MAIKRRLPSGDVPFEGPLSPPQVYRWSLIYVTALCLLLFALTGCLKETPPVQLPAPESEGLPPGKTVGPNPRVQASLKLTDQGRRMIEAQKPENAIRVLEQAISLNPDDGRNYYYLAEAWLMKKFVTEARKFNYLAEARLKGNEDWIRRVARQAERITALEIKIKEYR